MKHKTPYLRNPRRTASKFARPKRLALEPLEPRLLLAGGPRITEFMAINNTTLANETYGTFTDWIEIHNPTTATINLNGWSLSDDDDDLTQWQFPDVSLGAGDYLVVFASDKNDRDPAAELHTNFKLTGSGEYLALVEADGVTVAQAFAPEYPVQYADVSYGISAELAAEGYFTQPSPDAANIGEPVDDPTQLVLINEIMYHPSSEDNREEFIELVNQGITSVTLDGWQISAGVQFTFPDLDPFASETTLDPGEYLIVAADTAIFNSLYSVPPGTTVVGPWDGRLSNRGEAIQLVNAADGRVDRVEYADEGDWAVRTVGPLSAGHYGWVWTALHDGGGRSLELINSSMPNRYGQNWAASNLFRGTPGAVNSVASDNIAPLIQDVANFPIIPRSTDPVSITARIIDEVSADLTVTLHARLDGASAFDALPMHDDGQNGDGVSGDGVWGAILPAEGNDTVVEFYVEAADGGGNSRTWPAPTQPSGQQLTNLAYQVDDSFDGEAPWDPENQPLYRLILTEAQRAELAYIGRVDIWSYAQMNATFLSVTGTGIEWRHNVGVRNRGNSSRWGPPNNYRVNFANDRPWYDVSAIDINFRNSYNQVIAHTLFCMAGLPSADGVPVQVRVNGQNLSGASMYGSYAHLAAYNSDYADQQFPDDGGGNLYRAVSPWTTGLEYLGVNPQAYIDVGYTKRTNSSENDWSDLINLTYVLNHAPDATYVEDINEVINVDQWLRWFAVHALIANQETNLGNGYGDDFAMYRGIEDPRFVLLPHDMDTVLGAGVNDSIWRATALPHIGRFLTHPAFAPRYYATLIDLIETVFSPEQFNPLVEQALDSFVPSAVIENMKLFVVNRNNAVLAQIPQAFTVTSALPIVDGYRYSNTTSLALTGTAQAAYTGSVVVNGELAAWNPYTAQWTITDAMGQEQEESEILVPRGSVWRYLDDGSDQGTAWYAPEFDDASWAAGPAELGYGDADEATEVSFGPDANNKYITTYFRHTFHLADPPQDSELRLQLLRDDGAVVYLNGQEVARDNMPDGTVGYQDVASSSVVGEDESTFFPISINPGALVQGDNVLAVEIHQRSSFNVDISFNIELETVQVIPNPLALLPGINRFVVEAFEGSDGSGERLNRELLDIWYDPPGGGTVIPGGTITEDTTFFQQNGPYQITGDLTVAPGATLTILSGTTLFFDTNTRLIVRGRLVAEGEEFREIRFTRVPGGGDWGGVQLLDTTEDNRIAHAILEYGRTDNGMVGLENSNLLIDHATFDHTDLRRIRTINSSLIVRNSTFTDLFGDGAPPSTEDLSEHIYGSAKTDGGHFIVENNVFGAVKGHNDAIDVSGGFQPQPMIQILDNRFLGSGDNVLRLQGDALIEGNVFMHARKDQYNADVGESDVISVGDGHELVVVRNVFYDVEHVALIKEDALVTFENNTVVDAAAAALYFDLPGETDGPGRGARLDGNIFHNAPLIFAEVLEATELVVNRSILPDAYHDYGTGNLDEDPLVVDPEGGDFTLGPGSPAVGAGPNGIDIGAMVPAGVSIAGEPAALTSQSGPTLTFDGPGITHFKARLNEGVWSIELPIHSPIWLPGLPDGDYTLWAIGKNHAGVWQDTARATVSKTWTVDTTSGRVLINEVLAINSSAVEHQDAYPDLIELHNDGALPVDLSGMSISDDPTEARKFIFPADTILAAGEYLVLYADDETGTSELHLGFKLSGSGEGVFLYDTAATGGALLDSVQFGPQVADLSIGRVGHFGDWALTQPTFGSANVRQRTGDVSTLKINKWLADGDVLFGDDFVELYNPDPLPVSLAGLFLTDHPTAQPDKHEIAPLSFIAGSGWTSFEADGNPDAGADHVDFRLAAEGEMLGLYDAGLNEIDRILYFSQTTDVPQGRRPDGADTYTFFVQRPSSLAGKLVVTELNYNPHGPTQEEIDAGFTDNDDFEFIELLNTSEEILALEDLRFTQGIALQFKAVADETASIVITEAGTGTPDYFELQNASDEPIDTTGWVAVANNARGYDINDVHSPQWSFPPITYAGEIIYREDTADDNIYWRTSQDGWLLIVDDEGSVVDFVVWGYDTAKLATLHVEDVNGFTGNPADVAWVAAPVSSADAAFDSLQRIGSSDEDNASNWTFDYEASGGVQNLDLTVPFSSTPIWLAPGAFAVAPSNPAAFQSRYGDQVPLFGGYTDRLSNGGELITLVDQLGQVVVDFQYEDSNEPGWPELADGNGASLELIDPGAVPQDNLLRAAFLENGNNWRSSSEYLGSPGATGLGPYSGIVVNEVLTHTDNPLVDAIELHNPTGSEIDVGGWWLSDSSADHMKFQIPAGTTILAGEYVALYEGHYNADTLQFDQATEFGGPGEKDFAFSRAYGDDVWLMMDPGDGSPLRFVDRVEFRAALNGESFGRWPDGSGELYPMITRSFGSPNSGPRVGPELIISEVMYNPPDPDGGLFPDNLEFLEIYNPTGRAVDLTDWRLRKGFDFDFAAGTTLSPLETLVVVSFNPADAMKLIDFRNHYGIGPEVQILGGGDDKLSNTGEQIQLQRGDDPPLDDPSYIPYPLKDEVNYQNTWYATTNGGGESLNRAGTDLWGNEAAGWQAAGPTPGSVPLLEPSGVIDRYVFYNNSAWGTDIATDKWPLLPGQQADFDNYTAYVLGINGIMIDVADLAVPGAVTADDFIFLLGNDDAPGGWDPAPLPSNVGVLPGQGAGSSDRVVLTWDDHDIENRWLEVTMRANTDTGLDADDVFYFGNAVGETGNSGPNAKVDAMDVLVTRNNPHPFWNPAAIDDPYDHNRDRRVDAIDTLIARNHQTWSMTELSLIDLSGSKHAGPDEVPPSDLTTSQPAKASAHDAVLSGSKWDSAAIRRDLQYWLHELDRNDKENRSTEKAVDRLLAEWDY